MKFWKKALVLTVGATLITSLCVGCGKDQKTTYDNYSYGLTDAGLYENLDQYSTNLPNFKELRFTCDEILEWGVTNTKDSGYEIESVDDYVYLYGEELLTTLGLTNKEISAEGDRVSIDFEFFINGESLEDFKSSGTYEANPEGDSLVSSLIGRSVGEEYEVDFVFPEDDVDYPNQAAVVKIKVNAIADGSPIENGAVEANLDKIAEYLDGVTDRDTYLEALRPILAQSTLPSFVRNYIQTQIKIELPEEYIGYEDYRLRFRLQQIGYEYEAYLTTMEMTEADLHAYYEQLVLENYVCMLYFQENGMTITYADLATYYGENFDYIKSVQGEPYMRLALMRDAVVQKIAEDICLVGVDDVEETTDATEPTDTPDATEPNTSEPTETTPETTAPAESEETEESTASTESE